MATPIQVVIERNRARQEEARKLNLRAGRQIFPVLTQGQIQAWLLERLGGASRVAEITDFSALELPPLDSELVDKTLRENPNTITIERVGELEVHYSSWAPPSVSVGEGWQKLPPELYLPGGQRLAVGISVSGWLYSPNQDIRAAQMAVAEDLAKKAFGAFEEPDLPVPNPRDQGAYPEIQTAQYGQNEFTGEPLMAYGALSCQYPNFLWVWGFTRGDAEFYRDSALYFWNQIQEDERRIRKEAEETARAEAEAAQRTAERERQLAAGEVLENFTAWFRRGGMTNNGYGWVIAADGSRREPQARDRWSRSSDGEYHWDFVWPEELALRWGCHHVGDLLGNSTFEVVKLPVGGCTPAQLAAVRLIEIEDIGTEEGVFGLDPEATRRQDYLLAAVRQSIPTCPVTGSPLSWDLQTVRQLKGANGRLVGEGSPRIYNLLGYGAKFEKTCDGRSAAVIKTFFVGDEGVVEALAYDKYGQWNLALRYRTRRPDEKRPGEKMQPVAASPAKAVKLSASSLAGLFGGAANVVESNKKKRR